jgi:hypothetical protein
MWHNPRILDALALFTGLLDRIMNPDGEKALLYSGLGQSSGVDEMIES